jgi:hypothetical protein
MIRAWWQGIPGFDLTRWPPDRRADDAVAAIICALVMHQTDPTVRGTTLGVRNKVEQTRNVLYDWFAEAEGDWDAHIRRMVMAFLLGMGGVPAKPQKADLETLKRRAKWWCDYIETKTRKEKD